jgi:hypothetical protein
MNKKTLQITGLVLLLISCVLFTGCTDNSSSTNTTTQPSPVTTALSGGAKYVSGDIVRIPNSNAITAILIIGYDSATDMYERALIYPNEDGSWGYRMNTNTEKASRAVLEKVYTEKITNKPPASIVIGKPTVATNAPTASTTQTQSTSTPTITTTTTVLLGGKPSFKSIDPDYGTAGEQILITALTGTNFRSGATVTLMMVDNPNITATNVDVKSSLLITCTFNPPASTTAGAWDILITNPDGQFVRYSNIFSIHGSPNPTGTTTQTGSQGITSVSPTFTYQPDVALTIDGTNFQQGSTAKMVKTSDSNKVLTAREVRWDSATKVTAWFTIPPSPLPADSRGLYLGTYNVIVTNPDGTTPTLSNGFEVR